MAVESTAISLSLFICLVLLSITLYTYHRFYLWKFYSSSRDRTGNFTEKKLNSTNYIVFGDDHYHCCGFQHLRGNLACQIAIPECLNRTMIFPKFICISKQHATSFFHPTSTESRSILTESVININSLSKYLNIVSKDSVTVNQNNSVTYAFDSIPVVKAGDGVVDLCTVIRRFDSFPRHDSDSVIRIMVYGIGREGDQSLLIVFLYSLYIFFVILVCSLLFLCLLSSSYPLTLSPLFYLLRTNVLTGPYGHQFSAK